FGSGRHGMTLVADAGAGRYVELPLSYYPGPGWDYTPGHLAHPPDRRQFHPAGVPEDHLLFFECFNCHATGVTDAPDEVDLRHMGGGGRCERCRGPGESHGRAAEGGRPAAGTIRAPAREPAESEIRLCGECHRSEPPPSQTDGPALARF